MPAISAASIQLIVLAHRFQDHVLQFHIRSVSEAVSVRWQPPD
jgi:hypothetical protein